MKNFKLTNVVAYGPRGVFLEDRWRLFDVKRTGFKL